MAVPFSEIKQFNLGQRENEYPDEHAARQIFERLTLGKGKLGLDIDGVLFSGKGTTEDEWIEDSTAETLAKLYSDFDISLLTTRQSTVLNTISELTDGQVNLGRGKHSFDRGCIHYDGSADKPIVTSTLSGEKRDIYKRFQDRIDTFFFDGINRNIRWDEVFWESADWCKGDPRWESEHSKTIWYRYDDRFGQRSTKTFIDDHVRKIAEEIGADISLTHHGQQKLNLAWAKIYPGGITKASPLLYDSSMVPDVYIHDGGAGEKETMSELREKFGIDAPLMVVIGKSPDTPTADMIWCKENANILIPTTEQTYNVLQMISQMKKAN